MVSEDSLLINFKISNTKQKQLIFSHNKMAKKSSQVKIKFHPVRMNMNEQRQTDCDEEQQVGN
jgi:hypothetical protein